VRFAFATDYNVAESPETDAIGPALPLERHSESSAAVRGDCSIAVRRRGNVYLRKILIHRPRAAMGLFKRDRVQIGAWLDRLDARTHKNVVVIAIANI
jgi:hypothetical protein